MIHGTLIRLRVKHLTGDRDPKPVWLWSSRTGMTGADVDVRWQAILRRFDLEGSMDQIYPAELPESAPRLPNTTNTTAD